MKLWKYWKNLGIRSFPYDDNSQYFLHINGEKIEKIKVHAYRSHHQTYQLLRQLKTPQYQDLFLLRNKKAFNTFGFNQAYDVIIASRNGIILALLSDTKPNGISNYFENSHYIFFAAVGTIKFYNLKIKDIFAVTKDWLK